MSTLTVNSIDDAKSILDQKLNSLDYPKVAFIGQRGEDAQMFTRFMQIDLVICLDDFESNIPTISFEKILGKKELWYSTRLSDLLANQNIRKQINNLLPEGSLIIPYASFPELEKFCFENDYQLLGASYQLRSKFENKIKIFNLKRKLTLPSQAELYNRDEIDYQFLESRFGSKFVIQNPNGSSGTGTFIIRSQKDISENINNFADILIITPFYSGPTVSVNFVITDNQILYVSPSIQVIGQPELSISASTFSGVDYSIYDSVTTELQRIEIQSITKSVAEFMQSNGYRGVANINIMLSSLELTDINARFMGSGLLTVNSQIDENIIPISLIHILHFLGIDFELSDLALNGYCNRLNTSMIVYHSLEESMQVTLNAPIARTFHKGSVLDKNGRLLPEFRNLNKEILECMTL